MMMIIIILIIIVLIVSIIIAIIVIRTVLFITITNQGLLTGLAGCCLLCSSFRASEFCLHPQCALCTTLQAEFVDIAVKLRAAHELTSHDRRR